MEQPAAAAVDAAVDGGPTAQERLFAHCELGQFEELAAMTRTGRRGLFVSCVNSRGDTPLHVVRDVRCAELLLDSSGSHTVLNRQNGDGETPLMVSLRLGIDALASLYLDNGADIRPPNKHFQSCLHVAALSGMAAALDRLLAMRQLDPNQPDRMGNAALHYAVTFGDRERACGLLGRLLQESQLAVDAEDSLGRTAFVLAAQSGNLPACRLLRDRGCDLCHADTNGADALHLSSAVSSSTGLGAVRYLVADLAFSVDRSDKLGRTALFYAAHHGAEDTLAELLALGADPGRTDRLGRSPIHVAAERGHEACLARLLAAGANPWPVDSKGRTPLHLASANGHREVVKRLLRCERAGDFLESRDADGATARDLAGRAPQLQPVAELLAQAAKDREAQQQRQKKRRSYPRPRSAAAKVREDEVDVANKRIERETAHEAKRKAREQKELREEGSKAEPELARSSNPRPKSAVAAAPEPAEAGVAKPSPETELKNLDCDQGLEADEEAKAKAEEADEFPSDEDRARCYSGKQDLDAVELSEIRRAEEAKHQKGGRSTVVTATADHGIIRKADERDCGSKNIGSVEIKTDGEPEGPSNPQPPESSLHSTSDSSLKKTTVVVDDSSASATSSRPSSHLEEELHGNRRAREVEDRKHDPYLTAGPAWITGAPAKAQKSRGLHRSKRAAPNIAALRQRLYMYDSTVMLGRVLNEERRERMLLRGGAQLPLARLQLQQPQQPPPPQQEQRVTHRRYRRPMRPSTAADAERLFDRYRSINRETRQLLDNWKTENDSYGGGGGVGGTGSRPVSGRATPRTPSSSADRSGGAGAADGHHRDRTPDERRRGQQPQPAYRRPQSGSRFLDYFPNNRPSGGDGEGDGGRRGRAKSAGRSRGGGRPAGRV